MSKYKKLIGFICFISITLGGFAFYNTFAKSSNPKVEFKNIQGDSEFLSSIKIDGTLYSANHYLSSSFSFIDNDFVYPKDENFIDKLDKGYNITYNNALDNYRGFLRGKSPYQTFKETDEHIVYTSMARDIYLSDYENNSILISVLEKDTEEASDHRLSAPKDLSGHVSLEHTYINYPNMYVALRDMNHLNVYSLNLEQENLLFNKVNNLYQESNSNLIVYPRYSNTIGESYLELYEETGESDIIYLYNFETDNLTLVPTSDEVENPVVVTEETNIYVVDSSLNNYELYEVDIENDKLNLITSLQSIDLEDSESGELSFASPSFIIDGKLYSEINTPNKALIQINDIKTGELLYGGALETNDSGLSASIYQFDINK